MTAPNYLRPDGTPDFDPVVGALAPARRAFVIEPSDGEDLDEVPRSLRVYVPADAGEATVPVLMADEPSDENVLLLSFGAGVTVEPVQVRRVLATDLTEGVIVVGYA